MINMKYNGILLVVENKIDYNDNINKNGFRIGSKCNEQLIIN